MHVITVSVHAVYCIVYTVHRVCGMRGCTVGMIVNTLLENLTDDAIAFEHFPLFD